MTTTEVPPTEVVMDERWLLREAPGLIPVKWTAKSAKVTPAVIMQMIEDGILPAVRVGRRILVPRQAVLDLLQLPRENSA